MTKAIFRMHKKKWNVHPPQKTANKQYLYAEYANRDIINYELN